MRDIEVINTELILADLDSVQRRRERVAKDVKRGDKAAAAEEVVLAALETALDAGKPAFSVPLSAEERALARPLFLLTDKPTIFACNVKESDLATADTNPVRREGPRVREDPPQLRSRRHQRADRERSGRSDAGRRRGVPPRARRARKAASAR